MEKIIEEKKIEDVSIIPIIVNTVDDPNNLSVSSISPLPEKADEVVKTEEEERETPVIPKTEKKEEKKEVSEETLPEKKVEPKEKDSVQKRIDEITKKRREAERERDFEHTKRLELEEELKTAKKAIPQGDKPKVEDFETELAYLEALQDWKLEQKFRTESEKVSKEVASVDEKTAIDETYQELDEICEKGRTKYPDFNELVLTDNFKFSDAELEAILLSDTAGTVGSEDVLYYLGKHPEEAAEIAKLPSLKVAYEFGKIEAKLNAPPPRKKTTNAPEPITPVKTTGVTEKDPSQMTPREYRAWRERNKG